jgi:2-methylcitrate dehydratase PrpD
VDTLLKLMQEHAIEWRQIERIDVELAHKAVHIVDANPLWTHNIQYILAVAAHEGHIAMKHFFPEWTARADLTDLAAKVHLCGNDRLQQRFPVKKAAIVTIKTARGTYTGELDSPIGNPTAPLAPADLRAKFMSLATIVLDQAAAELLWTQLAVIERAANLDDITALLATKPKS